MLYTFAQADYSEAQLAGYLQHLTPQDAVVLWQDGVLLALKYPQLCQNCYLLDIDVQARQLTDRLPSKERLISLEELVKLTEQYAPQLCL